MERGRSEPQVVCYRLTLLKLHYICPSDEFLLWRPLQLDTIDSLNLPEYGQRKPQPDRWNEMLQERDGPQSGSFVQLYREKKAGSGTQDFKNCKAAFQPDLENIELDTMSDDVDVSGDVSGQFQDKTAKQASGPDPDDPNLDSVDSCSDFYSVSSDSKETVSCPGGYSWLGWRGRIAGSPFHSVLVQVVLL